LTWPFDNYVVKRALNPTFLNLTINRKKIVSRNVLVSLLKIDFCSKAVRVLYLLTSIPKSSIGSGVIAQY